MSFKKIIITFLLASLSLVPTVYAQDLQSFTLTYSERTDVGGDVNAVISDIEAQSVRDAEKMCNGSAKKINESQSFYHGPWAVSVVTLKIEFSCN